MRAIFNLNEWVPRTFHSARNMNARVPRTCSENILPGLCTENIYERAPSGLFITYNFSFTFPYPVSRPISIFDDFPSILLTPIWLLTWLSLLHSPNLSKKNCPHLPFPCLLLNSPSIHNYSFSYSIFLWYPKSGHHIILPCAYIFHISLSIPISLSLDLLWSLPQPQFPSYALSSTIQNSTFSYSIFPWYKSDHHISLPCLYIFLSL